MITWFRRVASSSCEKASSDGETMKMLGYKWTTEPDLLLLGLGELNLKKKVRGLKKPNLIPVSSKEDAINLLKTLSFTWRTILAKVEEFYVNLSNFKWSWLCYKLFLFLLTFSLWFFQYKYKLVFFFLIFFLCDFFFSSKPLNLNFPLIVRTRHSSAPSSGLIL